MRTGNGFLGIRVFPWCLYLGLCFILTGCGLWSDYENIRVVHVYDGDTVRLANGEKVRLIGIDCPEAYESEKLFRDARRSGRDIATIQAMGRRASDVTRSLLLGKNVRVEFDDEMRDKYGRLLAYLWIRKEEFDERSLDLNDITPMSESKAQKDGEEAEYIFANALIIQAGFASPMSIPPNTRYADMFRSLYREAKKVKRGLWQ